MKSSLGKAISLVAEALNISSDELTAESNFNNIDQWDSLGHMRIIMSLEAKIGRSLSGSEIMDIGSCSDIAIFLD